MKDLREKVVAEKLLVLLNNALCHLYEVGEMNSEEVANYIGISTKELDIIECDGITELKKIWG